MQAVAFEIFKKNSGLHDRRTPFAGKGTVPTPTLHCTFVPIVSILRNDHCIVGTANLVGLL